MKRDDFGAEKVLAGRDTRRQREVLPSSGGNHTVNTPFARPIETVFGNLEPGEAVGGGSGRVANLGEVENGGT